MNKPNTHSTTVASSAAFVALLLTSIFGWTFVDATDVARLQGGALESPVIAAACDLARANPSRLPC